MFVFACSIIALVICPKGKYPYCPQNICICPRIQLPVFTQWSQSSYVKVQGKMMHKDMHKIVFQSNYHISKYWNKV